MTNPSPRTGLPSGPGKLDHLYASRPPWGIDRPQPAIAALAQAGEIRGRVMDIGCGTGEHTLLAAGLGLDATGIDLATNALRIAQGKARERGLTARFLYLDAAQLAELEELFDTAIDSLVFHSLTAADRTAYLKVVCQVLPPGGRLFALCYRDEQPDGVTVPHRLARADIESSFASASGWRLDSLDAVTCASHRYPDGVAAWLAAATRL